MASLRDALNQEISEREFSQAVVDMARFFGWRVYRTHDSRRSPAGFPDIVAVRDGQVLAWELKTERGRATQAQREWLEDLAVVPGVDAQLIRPSDMNYVEEVLRHAL